MDILMVEWMSKPVWMWGVFAAVIATLLILDLGILHRKAHEISVRESIWGSVFYVAVALLFGYFVRYSLDSASAQAYLTGYIVEQTLSMDNIFVMSLIFGYLAIPRRYQHRVLFWGIAGVVILRGVMIATGAVLVERFEWVLYLFAAFLVFTGVKMLFIKEAHMDMEKNSLLKFLRKHFKITPVLHEQKFFVKIPDASDPTGKNYVSFITPLFVALILIEFADVLFAVDSVPAIFAITKDPYIVFTSNIFAILGLRSLYFSLSAMVDRFAYLKVSLAWVLIFIGSKVFITPLLGLEKFPANVSLGVTVGILAAGVAYSLYKTGQKTTK